MIPQVKNINVKGGMLNFRLPLSLHLPDELGSMGGAVVESFGGHFQISDGVPAEYAVDFIRNDAMGPEEYELIVDDRITISYGQASGAFYALMTLRQMLCGKLRRCVVSDSPSLKLRGFMLDVSRGKIPKLSSLKEIADLLASFKYNHLELYFEGLPYSYSDYEHYASPCAYTPAEMHELSDYCKARFIDLAPNLNTLGHMAAWLAIPEYKSLAEKEDGLSLFNISAPPTTLDCENPGSLELAVSLIDGLLNSFQSDYINVGLDEPFELGKGKNAEKAAKVGSGRLYIDYVKKLYKAVGERNKTMLMWGDFVARDFDSAKELPDDIILLEWGYQPEYPFNEHAATLHRLGKKFVICPGTSSWFSIGGITDNMTANITSAAAAAHGFGAMGMILTDWGDGGHVQCREISYPAILLFAQNSWNKDSDVCENQIARALNRFVFFDKADIIGSALFDIGRYSRFEEISLDCRTQATLPLLFPLIRGESCEKLIQGIIRLTLAMISPDLRETYKNKMERRKTIDMDAFDDYIEDLNDRLCRARPQCEDGEHVVSELKNAIRLIRALTHALQCLKIDGFDPETAEELDAAADEYRRLWQIRNRICGVEIGFDNIKKLASNLRGNAANGTV